MENTVSAFCHIEEPTISIPSSVEIETIIGRLRGAACICGSLSISAEAGKSKYSGEEMALLYDVLDYAIGELETILSSRMGLKNCG